MNTPPAAAYEAPSPDPVLGLLFGNVSHPMIKLPILRAAVELQVWANIAAGHETADEIASAAGADSGGMRRLLDALTMMKLLQKEHGTYRLPDFAEHYLLPTSPTYLGDFVLAWLAWEGHGKLAGAIRTGNHPINGDATEAESVRQFIPYYAIRALAPHRYIQRYEDYWQALAVQPREGLRVLDMACGAGIASLALGRQHSGIRIVLQDWPAMLDIAREAAERLGLENQTTTLPGDMLTVELPQAEFHIARLGFVTYFFGMDDLVSLFRRVGAALVLGGMLVIEAPLSDDERRQNEDAVLDGPWLFAVCAKGDVYSFSDYKRLLEQAGFGNVTQVREDIIKAVR